MSERKKGSTGVSLLFRLTDSTTGAAKSGLDVTTLKLQYERPGEVASTATSLTLLAALTTAHTDYGAKEVDATNSKGVYRIDCPDAGFASGADEVTWTVTGTGIEPSTRLIDLTSFDSRDVNGNLQGLSGTTAPAAGKIPTVGTAANQISLSSGQVILQAGTGTGQLDFTSGVVKANLVQILATALTETAGQIAAAFKQFFNVAAPTGTMNRITLVDTVTTVTGGATAASQTSILNAVNAITTNTARTSIVVPQFVPLPASGSTMVRVKITLYNLEGVVEDADANTVTVHASLADGTSEDGNLSSTTATRDSAGQYHVDYTLLSSAAEGGLYIAVTYAVGAVSMAANAVFAVAQADTVTSIAAIKAKTDNLPASPAAVGSPMTLTSAYDAAKTAAQALILGTPAGASIAADIAEIEGETDAIIVSIGTPTGASIAADIAAVKTDTGNLVTRITSSLFGGITSLAQWLGLLTGKQAGNSTARTEINATGAGSGTYNETNDSLQAIRDRGDIAWTTGDGGRGSGANTVTLTINNGSTAIQNAKVRVTSGASTYLGTTDINGLVTFNLDDDTWIIAITSPGYTFAGASLVVGGDVTHTYSMTALNITASNPGYTTGYATCYDDTGVVESGVVVTATIVQVDSSDTSHIYDTAALSATSDINGLVQFPNLVLGATYRITRGSGVRLITIPLSASSTYALPSFVGTP